ncbi:hypothetical protein PybrP1_006023 [[Pythium] brassicae (nom. inval.)]|nr:hypothetical protein PybrP1_006023 [[Pythium] brassicae (nom. inval.)]
MAEAGERCVWTDTLARPKALCRTSAAEEGVVTDMCLLSLSLCVQPSHKTFRTKQILAKKQKQNRPIPQWIRLRTGNTIKSLTRTCARASPGTTPSAATGAAPSLVCKRFRPSAEGAKRGTAASVAVGVALLVSPAASLRPDGARSFVAAVIVRRRVGTSVEDRAGQAGSRAVSRDCVDDDDDDASNRAFSLAPASLLRRTRSRSMNR